MADFLFGKLSEALSAGKKAANAIYSGPINGNNIDLLNIDTSDFLTNVDKISTISGDENYFIWGQKWGNNINRVG
jgi:hypothetical protein